MLKKQRSFMRGVLVAVLTAFAAGSASAAVDVTGVVAEINGAIAPVNAIGAAVLIVMVSIAVYKWVRRAM